MTYRFSPGVVIWHPQLGVGVIQHRSCCDRNIPVEFVANDTPSLPLSELASAVYLDYVPIQRPLDILDWRIGMDEARREIRRELARPTVPLAHTLLERRMATEIRGRIGQAVATSPPTIKQQPSPAELKTIRAILTRDAARPTIVLAPVQIPRGPEVRCPHASGSMWVYVCKECAGVLRTRSLVHRMPPLLTGNRSEDFASLRFQPHIIIRPDKGHNPCEDMNDNWFEYETLQSTFAERGVNAIVHAENKKLYTREVAASKEEMDAETAQLEIADTDITEGEALETICEMRQSVLEIGTITTTRLEVRRDEQGFVLRRTIIPISVAPPNLVARPEHKCSHGVSWGKDNCRVCSEITYKGKQARLIWRAIHDGKIRPVLLGHSRLGLFDGFALVVKSEIDSVLGVRDVINPEELQRYRDIISAGMKNTCIKCGAPIDRELNYCQACARETVMAVVPEAGAEYIQTWGEGAAFSETKARPLSGRNIDFAIVRLVARTFICGVLSEATGQEIGSLCDEVFMELCQWSPPMMTLLRRFLLFTRNVPLADIASLEGVSRKGIEQYFARWTEIIESVINPLD